MLKQLLFSDIFCNNFIVKGNSEFINKNKIAYSMFGFILYTNYSLFLYQGLLLKKKHSRIFLINLSSILKKIQI